jgi:hypothetical protein
MARKDSGRINEPSLLCMFTNSLIESSPAAGTITSASEAIQY